jgi:CheY-like chemotaxis protein
MFPMRVYPETMHTPARQFRSEPVAPPADTLSTLLVVAADADVHQYPGHQYMRVAALTMGAAMRQLARSPQLVVIDWDLDAIDHVELCGAAVAARALVLVAMHDAAQAPAALEAGCHSILLKPLTPMLIAARLGRLAREAATRSRAVGRVFAVPSGTHRVSPEIDCPYCGVNGPTSFEFCSHRRAWYACLSCHRVWLGVRFE